MVRTGEIVIYQTPDGLTVIDVKLQDETVWLTQAQMIQLFGRISLLYPDTLKIYLMRMSWMKKAICNFCILQTLTSRLLHIVLK
jgi:hypothetical protein